MAENLQVNCVRCNNFVKIAKTASKCKICGTYSHNSCLKLMKNVKFFKDGTVICCNGGKPDLVDSRMDNLSILTTSGDKNSSSNIDQITIKYLEELIKQKDQIIYNQSIAIQSLNEQILLLKRDSQPSISSIPPPPRDLDIIREKSTSESISKSQSTKTISDKDFSAAMHATETRQLCQHYIGLGRQFPDSQRKPNGRNILVGTGQNSSSCPFKAAVFKEYPTRLKYYHATKFDPNTDGEELGKYLKSHALSVSVKKLNSRKPDLYASFLISIPENESQKLLNSEI